MAVFVIHEARTTLGEARFPPPQRRVVSDQACESSLLIGDPTAPAEEDSVRCDFFARNAVHAAMAGKTGLMIGLPQPVS